MADKMRSALLALVFFAVPAALQGQDTEWNRYTLDGLGGVHLRTEANAACEAVGVSPSTIQADAAVVLLESEVPLLTQEEMLANPALPELRITLECVEGNGAFAWSVGVRVQQSTKMLRNEQITLSESVTWYTTGLGVTSRNGAQGALKEALSAKLAEFSTAWVDAHAEGETSR